MDQDSKKSKIILLNDIYDLKKQKEKELKYYNEQMEKLKEKLFFINKEIEITNVIIGMIEREAVVDIKQLVEKKKEKS